MSSFTNEPKKMNRKEEEIYNILYQKKEINDKTPKFRTEDKKKKLKSLSYKISKISDPSVLATRVAYVVIFYLCCLFSVCNVFTTPRAGP